MSPSVDSDKVVETKLFIFERNIMFNLSNDESCFEISHVVLFKISDCGSLTIPANHD